MGAVWESSYLSAIAAGLSLAVLFRSIYLWLLPKPLADVPHNPITSILGDIPDITRFTQGGKNTFGEYVATCVGKYGLISQLLLGRTPLLIIADRLEAERILLKGKSTDQSKRTNEIFATVIPTGQISQSTNDTWRRHRRLTGPSMSRRYLERMSTRILAGANNLVRLWIRKVDLIKDGAFDADKDLQLATLDTIVNITMGHSPGCIDDAYTSLPPSAASLQPNTTSLPPSNSPPFHTAIRRMVESIESTSQAAFPSLSARLFVWPSPSWRKSYHLLSSFFNDGIAQARTREQEHAKDTLATDADCVLDMIVQRESREGTEHFGKGELVDELLTYVIAGQDTTAATLAWLVKLLPQDMDIQKRLRDELFSVFGSGSDEGQVLDFDALDNPALVPVLEAVVAETLRCAKVGSMTGRELIEDEVILGRCIPKGTQLMFATAVMSSQESDWGSDAGLWRPTRWLRSDGSFNRAAGPSIPFGLGQRSCFGQRLAVLQLKVFLTMLSRTFEFKLIPAELESWDAVECVTRQPKSCYVSLERWSMEESR